MPRKMQPHETALADSFEPLLDLLAYELKGESAEGVILEPLGGFPLAAAALAVSYKSCDDPYIRCVVALIPGYAPECHDSVLATLWQEELERRSGDADEEAILETSSVAERLLVSCVRWLRHGGGHAAEAQGVLTDMVKRAIKGEEWHDAHWALSALCKYGCKGADGLVRKFSNISTGPSYFPEWGKKLAARDPQALGNADELVDGCDAGARHCKLSKKQRAQLDTLLAAARAYDKAES